MCNLLRCHKFYLKSFYYECSPTHALDCKGQKAPLKKGFLQLRKVVSIKDQNQQVRSLQLPWDRIRTKLEHAAFRQSLHAPTRQSLCILCSDPVHSNAQEPVPLPHCPSLLLPQTTCACARLSTGNGSDDASRRSRLRVWIWGMGKIKKKKKGKRKVFQLLTIFSLPSNKQHPQSRQLLQNCHFYPCCSTKQLRAVPAVPWHKTTGGCGSCFCWAQNREAIYFGCISVQWVMFRLENWPQLSRRSSLPAKLACYPISPSSISPPYLLP